MSSSDASWLLDNQVEPAAWVCGVAEEESVKEPGGGATGARDPMMTSFVLAMGNGYSHVQVYVNAEGNEFFGTGS